MAVTPIIEELPEPGYEVPDLPGTEDDYVEELDDDDELSTDDRDFFQNLAERILLFSEEFCGIELFAYQREFALRIILSIISNDGAETTVLASRQCGKSATLGTIITGMLVLLPRLALSFPEELGKFKDGFMVGIFAPTEDQANTVWGRVFENFTSPRAIKMLGDPEIEDKADKQGSKIKTLTLRNSRSLCRMQSANRKANIESKSYHYVLIDEAQDVDSEVAKRSIYPMLAFYNGSRTLTGTARRHKNVFYEAIQNNKRRFANGRCRNRDHFEYTYKTVIKYNTNYKKFVASEKARLGEDSDEFRMSYMCTWLLESGMYVTEEVLDACADRRMDIVQDWWQPSKVVVGIDPGRTNDSTVVTVMWVDWDHPDAFGVMEHRILNWLEIHNKPWEEQYALIYQFLRRYNILRIGVDGQGMGSAVAERLEVLFPDIEVKALNSDGKNQEDRWEYFKKLIERDRFVYPAGGRTRRTRNYKKFILQFSELETVFAGKYMLASAPDGRNNHDDYPDSACIACFMSTYQEEEAVEMIPNFIYARAGR